ncbi:hypothetical protein ABFS83_14G064800 [Erythranthe nasuta]
MATHQHYRLHRMLLDSYVTNNTNISYRDNDATNFDSNMVIILAALLCALICALGLNSIVRCAVRCAPSTWVHEAAVDEVAAVAAADRLSSSGNLMKKEAELVVVEIPAVVYKAGILCIPAATDCTICLGEFVEGEDVRILPRCNHGFHVECIDTWLALHCSCPVCRQTLLMDCSARECSD